MGIEAMTTPDRPNRNHTLMAVAHILAHRSTCTRSQVGAVISLGGRILSTGYNGAPAGMPHCDHICTCNGSGIPPRAVPIDGHQRACRYLMPCATAVHAEANAIAYAARFGVALHGAALYTTMSPCLSCAQFIISAGINEVFYGGEYRDNAGMKLLESAYVSQRKVL